ncbi:MAG: rhodanese-like domain-containing protein [Polyangiaceae bacterium]
MSEPSRVPPDEALRLVEEEGYVHLDVRTEAEWAAGHPSGAHNVPFMLAGPSGMTPNPEFHDVVQAIYPTSVKLVVSCKSGGRSLRAARELLARGYAMVVDQRAGWDGARNGFGQITEPGWSQRGLPHERETPGASYAELRARATPTGGA